MAKTKLTLSVDKALIVRAKRFSQRNDTTVSEMVSRIMATLDDDRGRTAPNTTRQRGYLPSGAKLQEHRRHLKVKHR